LSANLDLVRSIIAAWERGDFSSVTWADPEIEYEIPDGPSPGRWKGLAGMAEGAHGLFDPWDEVHVEAPEFRELGAERVLVLAEIRGRGRASGLELQGKGAYIFELHDGKVTRHVAYWDRGRAFADLGLAG
jgi:ketosteroid isomerase-like protein